ncbi:OLC1v1002072C1 [Oldenlandia corymbosa var. corymbosa]|uniref:OLC1v1002072C1 n=1 Tax=Oldenlandia corymbosa var. corymbosa TaxID=529605 RepID=A0AAV1D7Y6_OLDCO|nr:OLC1v1002072C1 [Oldenlandia corymbosa var. corymbosa]
MNGVLTLKIVNPELASYEVEKPKDALIELAWTTMENEIGKISLEKIFLDREKLNSKIAKAVDETAADWGLECLGFESDFKVKSNVVTNDGRVVTVDTNLHLKVVDPKLASYAIENPIDAVVETAKSAMGKEVVSCEADEAIDSWEGIDEDIGSRINRVAQGWGIECLGFEIKDLSSKLREVSESEVLESEHSGQEVSESEYSGTGDTDSDH